MTVALTAAAAGVVCFALGLLVGYWCREPAAPAVRPVDDQRLSRLWVVDREAAG